MLSIIKAKLGFNLLFLILAHASLLFFGRLAKIDGISTNTENRMQEDHTKEFKDIEARIDQLRGFL
jgi:hypothetical protein